MVSCPTAELRREAEKCPRRFSSCFASAAVAERIYERARLTGEFRLRSGAVSEEYFDKYLFESDPHLLRERPISPWWCV
jgi:hypothetical protein